MEPTDNSGAPIVPAGTQPTAFGTASFTGDNQAFRGVSPANNGQGLPMPAQAPAQQAAPSVQEAPQGTTFAELAAKKGFKSVDDLANAYQNLESHSTKVTMTAADIIKAVQEATPIAEPAPIVPQAVSQDQQAIKIVEAIVDARTKPLQERVALQDLFLKNPDAAQYASGIAQVVKENPGIKWEAAYKLAKFDAAQEQARQQGTQQAYQNMQTKVAAVAGTSVPTQRSGPDVRNMIKDRSVPFSEITRVMKEAGYYQ